ncbi:MAG: glycosyltransferase family 39 protein [Saprospiraceae bacterium]|nr:glycosyltransferase family 39 protein [Saprospiraceae bacterium]
MLKEPKEIIVVASLLIAKIIIHIYSTFVSGYHWDELLHIESGNHLAWGYADYPPMIGLIAWIQNLADSESLFVNRFFIHLTGVATLVVSAKLVKKLGGNWKAVLIALLCLICSPIIGTSHTLFLPVGFSQFFQLLAIYFLVSYYADKHDKYLYLCALAFGMGFMTKYLIGYLIISLTFSTLLFDRLILKNKAVWGAVVLFLLLILPNAIWQITHNFPVIDHISALIDTDLNRTTLGTELVSFAKFFNPIVLIISFMGMLLYSLHKKYHPYRVIGFALLTLFLLIICTNGKFYYTVPAIIPAISLGAVRLEKWIDDRKLALYLIIFSLLITGIILVPFGVPFFTPEKFVKLYRIETLEDGRTPIYFDHFQSKNLWPQILSELQEIIDNLPEEERQKCIIWGKHYGYTGIVDLFREEYNFPTAINHMGVYHDWIPELDKEAVYITTGEINLTKNFWLQFFNSVVEVSMIKNKYSWDYKHAGIRFYVCRGLKYNKDEVKQIIDKFYGI